MSVTFQCGLKSKIETKKMGAQGIQDCFIYFDYYYFHFNILSIKGTEFDGLGFSFELPRSLMGIRGAVR